MTCIAGAIRHGEVCIGGDAVSLKGSQAARVGTEGKVFRVGEFLIGSAGTVRAHQLIRYLFNPPPIENEVISYMVQRFIPVLRELMKENGEECDSKDGKREMDARFLIGVRGRLFEIDPGYGVFECKAPYAAIGCADQEALAAMYVANRLLDQYVSAQAIVENGLLAAAEFDTSIRPPFTMMMLREDDWKDAEFTIAKPNGEWGTCEIL